MREQEGFFFCFEDKIKSRTPTTERTLRFGCVLVRRERESELPKFNVESDTG